MTTKKYTAKILEKYKLSDNVFEVVVKLDSGISSSSGQYVWVYEEKSGDPKKVGKRQMYFVSSISENTDNLKIVVSETSEFPIVADQILSVEGPFGRAIDSKEPTLFVCQIEYIGVFLSFIESIKLTNTSLDFKLILINNGLLAPDFLQKLKEIKNTFKNYEFSSVTDPTKIDFDFLKNNTYSQCLFCTDTSTSTTICSKIEQLNLNYIDFQYIVSHPLQQGEYYLTPESFRTDSSLSIFKLLVEQSYAHMIVTDINGKIVYANKSAERLTGYEFSEMLGHTPRLWGGLMEPQIYKKMWHTIKVEKLPFKSEITNRNKSGVLYRVVATITPIFDLNGKLIAYLGTEEDVTHHINLEMELKSKSNQLERLNKLMVDRELKMIEIKHELKKLKQNVEK